MKIIRNILVGIFSVVALVFGLIFYSSSRTIPLKDRQQLSGGAVQVKDGMVSVGLIPSGDGQVMLVDCGNLGDSADSGKDGRLLPAKRFVSNDMGQNHASLKKLAKKLKPQTPEIQFMELLTPAPCRELYRFSISPTTRPQNLRPNDVSPRRLILFPTGDDSVRKRPGVGQNQTSPNRS